MDADGNIEEQRNVKERKASESIQDIDRIPPPHLRKQRRRSSMPAKMKKRDSAAIISAPFSNLLESTSPEDEVLEADRRTGDVETYWFYFATASWADWSVYMLFVVAFTFLQNFPSKSTSIQYRFVPVK